MVARGAKAFFGKRTPKREEVPMTNEGGPVTRRRFLQVAGLTGGAVFTSQPLDRFLGLGEARAQVAGESGFPLAPEAAERILREARGRGAEFADLYLERRARTSVRLAGGVIESVEQGLWSGCGVRAVDGERTGYAYADSFDEGVLAAAARDAAAIASSSAPEAATIRWRREHPPRFVRHQRSFEDVPQDERVRWILAAEKAARGADPAISEVTIEHLDEMLRFLVINSDGLWIEDVSPLFMLRINAVAERGGRRANGLERLSYRLGAERLGDDAPVKAGREAARKALAMLEAGEAPSGEMPVVIAAGGGVLFHEAVGHGLEGDGVRLGISFYTGRMGERVASEKVTIFDTGALADLRGSFNIDDEGQVPQPNLLIEKGVLRGFLNDRITSLVLKASRTGSGRRESYRYPPMVRMSNTYLQPGEDDPAEIIRQTGSGLYARALGGGEVDTTTGNFTFGVLEGYLIEGGRVTAPVRGANLVGNGPEIMKRIDLVGADQEFWPGTCGKGQWVPVSAGAPTLRISSMTVGGSAGS